MNQPENPRKDFARLAAYIADFSVCGLIASPLDSRIHYAEKIAYYIPPGLTIFLILMTARSLIFRNKSFGMLLFGIQVTANDGFSIPSLGRVVFRDAIMPLVFVFAMLPVSIVSVILPNSRIEDISGKTAGLLIIAMAVYLHRGMLNRGANTIIDRLSGTRIAKRNRTK